MELTAGQPTWRTKPSLVRAAAPGLPRGGAEFGAPEGPLSGGVLHVGQTPVADRTTGGCAALAGGAA